MDAGKSAWIEILSGDWSGPLHLRVQGRSMWPTLRPGDQVTVEPVAVDALRTGDYVLVEQQRHLFLHRFLGFDRQGRLLTKGDGHRAFDPPWPPEALRGRAVARSRDGKAVPISSSSLWGKVQTGVHRLMATAWSLLRRVVPLMLLLGLSPVIVLAAVELIGGSFQAIPVGQAMRIVWETASETDMLGFHVHRAPYQALSEGAKCSAVSGLDPLPGFVWAQGDVGGASYAYTDTQDLVVGKIYYYCLEAEDQNSSQFHGPITGTIPLPATATPTPTPTPTPIPTPTPRVPLLPPATSTSTFTPTPTSTPVTTSTVTPTSAPGATAPSATPSTLSPTSSLTPSAEATSSTTPGTPTLTPTPSVEAETSESPTESSAPAATSTPTLDQTLSATGVATSTTTSATQAPTASSPVQTPDATAASVAQAAPSLSPTPAPSPVRRPETNGKPQVSWGIVLLALIAGGSGLILLGAWGFWWVRRKT